MGIKTTKKIAELAEPPAIYTRYEKALENPVMLVLESQKGVVAAAFFDLAKELDFPTEKLAALIQISLKSLIRYRQSHKKLEPHVSEHLLKLILLFQKGKTVFGDIEAFKRWLEKPAHGIGNLKPISLVSTPGGVDLVLDELRRIEFGDFS